MLTALLGLGDYLLQINQINQNTGGDSVLITDFVKMFRGVAGQDRGHDAQSTVGITTNPNGKARVEDHVVPFYFIAF